MRPNISFLHNSKYNYWEIHYPLNPPAIGGKTISETFNVAFNQNILLSNTEKVLCQNKAGTRLDIDFEDFLEMKKNGYLG